MIRTILCPVDLTDLSRCATRLAGELGVCLGARVVLHHNVDAAPPSPLAVAWMWSEDHEHEAEAKVADAARRLEALFAELPGVEVEGKLTRGPLDAAVLEVARQTAADLLVIGTHGQTTPAHDSLTEQIVLQTPCPILTLGDACRLQASAVGSWFVPGRVVPIVVPTDFGKLSLRAVSYATALAEELPLELHLVHALGDRSGRAGEREARARLRGLVPESLSERASYAVVVGKPADAILSRVDATGARFVLMTAHRKGLLRRTVSGTTTLEVMHSSRVPIWFVPERALSATGVAAALRAAVE